MYHGQATWQKKAMVIPALWLSPTIKVQNARKAGETHGVSLSTPGVSQTPYLHGIPGPQANVKPWRTRTPGMDQADHGNHCQSLSPVVAAWLPMNHPKGIIYVH